MSDKSIKKSFIHIKQAIGDMSIRSKLIFVFVFLILIPSTIIAYLSFYKSKDIIKGKIIDYNIDILNEVSKNIEFRLSEIGQMSIMLFTSTELQNALSEICNEDYDEYKIITIKKVIENILFESTFTRDYIDTVTVFPNVTDGTNITTSLDSISLSDDEKKVIDSYKGSLTWLDVNRENGTIKVARVIYDLKRQVKMGYLVINIREHELYNIYNKIKYYKKGEFYIISDNGKVISHEDKDMLGGKSEIADLFEGNNGTFTKNISGKDCYITYYRISGTDWKLVGIIPVIEYEKDIISLKNWILLISISCALLAILFSLVLSSGISKPILKLSRMMKEVGKGNFNIFSSYNSKNEIGILSSYFNSMVKKIDSLINQTYHQELLNQKAELKSLNMQLNPHFIYNTLESIHWLANTNRTDDIEKMVKALGDFMRSNVGQEEFISLEDEINSISNYLLILKYRYGDKLETAIHIQQDILPVKIPKFTLQPIVENAIVHGIEMKIGNSMIIIDGYSEGDLIIINVTDNGIGMSDDMLKGILTETKPSKGGHTGIGLSNVVKAILDSNKKIPDDIAVIGFDNSKLCEMSPVSISSIGYDKYDIGHKAGTILCELIEGKPVSAIKLISLKPELILRNSSPNPI